MNNNKYLKLQKQYNDTVKKICQSNAEFNRFIVTAQLTISDKPNDNSEDSSINTPSPDISYKPLRVRR